MPLEIRFRDAAPVSGMESTSRREWASRRDQGDTEPQTARAQHAADTPRARSLELGSRVATSSNTVRDMVRYGHVPCVEPVIDLVDDGLSDAEIAARFVEWLGDLDGVPVVLLPVSALDELRSGYAADNV